MQGWNKVWHEWGRDDDGDFVPPEWATRELPGGLEVETRRTIVDGCCIRVESCLMPGTFLQRCRVQMTGDYRPEGPPVDPVTFFANTQE